MFFLEGPFLKALNDGQEPGMQGLLVPAVLLPLLQKQPSYPGGSSKISAFYRQTLAGKAVVTAAPLKTSGQSVTLGGLAQQPVWWQQRAQLQDSHLPSHPHAILPFMKTQALDPPIEDTPWDMKCGERKHLTCNQDRKRDAAEGGSGMWQQGCSSCSGRWQLVTQRVTMTSRQCPSEELDVWSSLQGNDHNNVQNSLEQSMWCYLV